MENKKALYELRPAYVFVFFFFQFHFKLNRRLSFYSILFYMLISFLLLLAKGKQKQDVSLRELWQCDHLQRRRSICHKATICCPVSLCALFFLSHILNFLFLWQTVVTFYYTHSIRQQCHSGDHPTNFWSVCRHPYNGSWYRCYSP